MPIQSSFMSPLSRLSERLPFLVPSLRYIAEIYGLFAGNAKSERSGTEGGPGGGGQAEGWFDKSLLVKRLPDCRERNEQRGDGVGPEGGCDLRPMAEFLSDADCSRLL